MPRLGPGASARRNDPWGEERSKEKQRTQLSRGLIDNLEKMNNGELAEWLKAHPC